MDEYTTVEIPGALNYTITFDAQSKTEQNYGNKIDITLASDYCWDLTVLSQTSYVSTKTTPMPTNGAKTNTPGGAMDRLLIGLVQGVVRRL